MVVYGARADLLNKLLEILHSANILVAAVEKSGTRDNAGLKWQLTDLYQRIDGKTAYTARARKCGCGEPQPTPESPPCESDIIDPREPFLPICNSDYYRAIVGTAILKYPQWIKSTLAEFPGRLMASLDAVNGEVMIEGWQAESGHTLADAIKAIDALGFREIVYTDIKQDGTLKGPNLKSIEAVLGMTHMGVFASGGISGLADLHALKSLEAKGLRGCILGKALYAGKMTLPEALAASK